MTDVSEHNGVVRLLMEQRTSLFAYILAIVRDYETAEEVLQEVSVAICQSSDQFSLGTNFGAWSREIARRRILAHHRASARLPSNLSLEDLAVVDAGFETAELKASPHERIDALRGCLKSLTEPARRILQLRFGSCFSLRDIAEQLGRQPESIRKAIFRSRQSLRECIERRLRLAEGEA